MSSGTFVDRIDPFAKRSLKKKQKKSQGSSRYRTGGDAELTALPLLKGKFDPWSVISISGKKHATIFIGCIYIGQRMIIERAVSSAVGI